MTFNVGKRRFVFPLRALSPIITIYVIIMAGNCPFRHVSILLVVHCLYLSLSIYLHVSNLVLSTYI